jgi:formylglycine-generating enzyme required for sulfatase activity
LEISVTYAFLSHKPDLFFTAQARTFARRVEDQKAKNRELLMAATPKAETAEPPKPVTTAEPQATREPLAHATEADDNRPVLVRRGSPPKDSPALPAPTVADQVSPGKAPPIGSDQDNVVYRRSNKETGNDLPSKNRKAPAVNRSNVSLSPEYQQAHEVEGMVLIPAGYVTLGSDDPGDSEKPVHRVQVGAFYLDKYEVTNFEYQKFCAATGRPMPVHWRDGKFPAGQERHPVVQLTWQDALAYARWAGKRLPTEAEWERAAKGPNSTRYAYGNAYDATKGNSNSSGTKPVGSALMNGFGLYDMTGNVSEWTSTCFMPYPYKADDGREDGQASGPRVIRGGDYTNGEKDSRCLHRSSLAPDQAAPTVGFRCARDSE